MSVEIIEQNEIDLKGSAEPQPQQPEQTPVFQIKLDTMNYQERVNRSQAITHNKYKEMSKTAFVSKVQGTQSIKDEPAPTTSSVGTHANIDLEKIAKVESNGKYNAQNPNSSAYGKYQFIDSTREAVAKKYNISNPKSEQGQEEAMRHFTNENTKILKNNKLPVNTLTAYALHQQGGSGGIQLLTNKMSEEVQELVVANTPESYRTGNPREDWIRAFKEKLQ